ncbi:glycosyltransferase family 1 protein [Nocardia puris]|uniref:UDP:flavonoid glycosyltransferase YjiC (YdhE family) n=1 Tax=Nocardia puris TaxID=208602 RepID=A0A366DFY7_9NOCA|nr:glycosyltransferase [Nocardia puris]MBF6212033.1 glycosyltransferase family 1 protein [Nocardia puris]MBF6367059.1 glycosyltransferase family 1 protein [Nocardia puris]RBO88419.1 UDP:flavonoid glycosyltransferase YjiC (YdhE family) [Nocardia puris]
MRVAIPLTGTRGDVQPAVALGLELRRRGHDVVVGAPPNLVDFTTRTGLTALPCGPDVQQLYSSDEGQRALAAGSSFRLMQLVGKQMAEYAARMNREVIEVCRDADVIVSTLLTEDRAMSVAEAMGVPQVTMHGFPGRKNSAYPFPGTLPPHWRPPGWVNRATWSIGENLRRVVFLRYLNQLRGELGLPKSAASPAAVLGKRGVPEVQIYDRALVPGLAEEWGERRPLVGFLPLERSAREAIGELAVDHGEVLAWIGEGEPPVYFGFGSMPIRDTHAVLAIVEQVCARLGRRGLVSAGWSDLDAANAETGASVRVVGPLAHDIVFPLCAAAVHHGGIGTTFESLRAGLPTLVCSVSFDQPMWGGQVERLGVGAHLPFQKLNADRLAEGVRTLLAPETAQRAKTLSAELHSNADATQRTADIVERAAE